MASPAPNSWLGPAPGSSATMPTSEPEGFGLQTRSMGLKVHYTFDKDGKVNCLARWPQTLQVQALPLDETSWIGVVDLRTCLQAIAQCSPEIVSQIEHDYTVYAFDYSEPDTPLVGQGMMSWVFDPASSPAASQDDGTKMVTGRVTKNMLALFGNGVRETLEVKLKLTEVPRLVRSDANGADAPTRSAATPTDTTEWSSFVQSHPTLGRSASVATMNSPNLAPARPDMSQFQQPAQQVVPPSAAASRPGSRPASRQSSMPPSYVPPPRAAPPLLAPRIAEPASAPTPPAESASALAPAPAPASRPSRPSSRTRSRVPTGRPRGRPRKRQPVDGNTSAAEEQPTDADADDAPKRKRAKTTKANYPTKTSLDGPPDSLRVAASTSGSLRTMRPILAAPPSGAEGTGNAAGLGSHLQEVPRAPTPVPQGMPPNAQHARRMLASKPRRESMADLDSSAFPENMSMYARSENARSPTDSIAQSPENYTPEDSPADIGSSPPVPRSATFVPRSSPMPSSPILPPMPRPQPDSGFMSGGVDDMFDEDECLNDHMPPPPTPQELTAPTPTPSQPAPSDSVAPSHPPSTKPLNHAGAASASRAASQPPARKNNPRQNEQYSFMAINPGPPELLPVTSIYDPPPPPKPKPVKGQRGASANGKAATLQRSYSGPLHQLQAQQAQTLPRPTPQDQRHQSPQGQGSQEPQEGRRQQSPPQPSESHQPAEASMSQPADTHMSEAGSAAPTPLELGLDFRVMDGIAELGRLLGTEDERDTAAETPVPNTSVDGHMELSLPQMPMPPHNTADAPGSKGTNKGIATSASTRLTVPASDPAALPGLSLPALPPPATAFSEAPYPLSEGEALSGRSNKNLVRKAAIRERLQKAIDNGEMPEFCQNCGALETPTWRKMWTQDHEGEPGYHEYSEKPGQVTAIDILERNEEGRPTRYRLVKKALGPAEDNKFWTQMLLCNPCGIWLGKFKSHRPSDRWEKDASRLNQPRRKKDSKGGSRSRRARTKSDTQLQPTSEAYFTTDPAGPIDFDDAALFGSSIDETAAMMVMGTSSSSSTFGAAATQPGSLDPFLVVPASTISQPDQDPFQAGSNQGPASRDGSASKRRGPGSTHSRGSGTANSPIAVDDHFGKTRRLLFPSPRKDTAPKVLGELAVNAVASTPADTDKAAVASAPAARQKKGPGGGAHDDMVDLFGTPPPASRPSTPPPRSDGNSAGPFKTPTRPTPSHRPITRSVSKSIRSGTSCPKSPSTITMLLQRTPSRTPGKTPAKTPSKTPRSAPTSASKRCIAAATPDAHRLHAAAFHMDGMSFDSPFASTLNQLLSEANDFTTGSPSHGLSELDIANFGSLDSDGLTAGFHSSAANIDFSSYLDTDLVMPSSSPQLGRKGGSSRHHQVTFGGALTFDNSDAMWTEFSETIQEEVAAEEA